MGSRSFGRSDRPVAALSAEAICDAIRIGFLSWSLKHLSAGGVFDRNVATSQEADAQQRTLSDDRGPAELDSLAVQMRAENRCRLVKRFVGRSTSSFW